MQTVQYQRWNPPQSPVRVEFPPQLPSEVALEPAGETRGSLYGLQHGGEIRVLVARSEAGGLPARGRARDEHLVGLEKIGIFVRRARGEVFLAESDLERFEGQRAAVALVIAGDRAGFFVRQADGSIQTIRSHEEFTFTPGEPLLAEHMPVETAGLSTQALVPYASPTSQGSLASSPRRSASKSLPAQPRTARRAKAKTPSWPRAAAVLLAIPLAGLAYFGPLSSTSSSAPVQLRLKQVDDAVAISWNPSAAPRGARLEILDGLDGTKVDVRPDQSSLSYAPHSRNLEVRMTAGSVEGAAPLDSASLALETRPIPVAAAVDSSELQAQVETLEAEASGLRESLNSGRVRMAGLQKDIDKLTHR
jgi:hypothetical protein